MRKIKENKTYFLESELFYLRKIEQTDIDERYYSWLNDQEIIRFMEIRKFPNSFLDMQNYILDMSKTNSTIMFAICMKEDNIHIGNMKLWNIDWINRNAKISILIGDKKHNGKGIATKAVELACKYAFDALNLHKLHADIHEENVASLKVFKKNGFIQEGLLLENEFFEGKWSNRVLVGKVSSN